MDRRLHLTLNDKSASMLVRDALLLELFRDGAPAEVLMEAWGCLGVHPATRAMIVQTMESLLEFVGAECGAQSGERFAFLAAMDAPCKAACAAVLRSWLGCKLSFNQVQKVRLACVMPHLAYSMSLSTAAALLGPPELSEMSASAAREHAVAADIASSSTAPKSKNKQKRRAAAAAAASKVDIKFLRQYLKTLCLAGPSDATNVELNPTLLEVTDLRVEKLCFFSSFVRVCGTVDFMQFLSARATGMQEALRSGRVTIRLAPGNLFQFFAPEFANHFRAADFTNVADYVGLANILALARHTCAAHAFCEQMRFRPQENTNKDLRFEEKDSSMSTAALVADANWVSKRLFECALGCHSTAEVERLTGWSPIHLRVDCAGTVHMEWRILAADKSLPLQHVVDFFCRQAPEYDCFGGFCATPETLARLAYSADLRRAVLLSDPTCSRSFQDYSHGAASEAENTIYCVFTRPKACLVNFKLLSSVGTLATGGGSLCLLLLPERRAVPDSARSVLYAADILEQNWEQIAAKQRAAWTSHVSRTDGRQFILHIIHRVIYDREHCRLSVCAPQCWFSELIKTGKEDRKHIHFCLALETKHGWQPLMPPTPITEW